MLQKKKQKPNLRKFVQKKDSWWPDDFRLPIEWAFQVQHQYANVRNNAFSSIELAVTVQSGAGQTNSLAAF